MKLYIQSINKECKDAIIFQKRGSMAYELSDKLVVAISSRALFDLEIENKIFDEKRPASLL